MLTSCEGRARCSLYLRRDRHAGFYLVHPLCDNPLACFDTADDDDLGAHLRPKHHMAKRNLVVPVDNRRLVVALQLIDRALWHNHCIVTHLSLSLDAAELPWTEQVLRIR